MFHNRREYRMNEINSRSYLQSERIIQPLKKSSFLSSNINSRSIDNNSNLKTNVSRTLRRSSTEVIRNSICRKSLYMNMAQLNRMITKMVFIICAVASFEHLLLTVVLQMFTSSYFKPFILDMIFLANFSMLLKSSMNFFIFYHFNAFFRKRINKYFVIRFN